MHNVEYIKANWKKVPIHYYDYKKLDKSLDPSSSYQSEKNKTNQPIDNSITESEKSGKVGHLKWVLISIGIMHGVPGALYMAHLILP